MNTRSLIFSIFGLFLKERHFHISNQSLTAVMKAFGYQPEAVRAAAYRMVKQGWLLRKKEGRNTYYYLTQEGKIKIKLGVYRMREIDQSKWDGNWYLLTYSIPEDRRNVRDDLRRELNWLGFGQLSLGTWITPWNMRDEVEVLISNRGLVGQVEFFKAEHLGFVDNLTLCHRCWSFMDIFDFYENFIREWEPRLEQFRKKRLEPVECFKELIFLDYSYRKSLHYDPKIPFVLLSEDWIGKKALILFEEYYRMLIEPASEYFTSLYHGQKQPTN